MKTKYKYISFAPNDDELYVNNKVCWNCKNNKSGDVLGKIFYYPQWKQYCFTQESNGIVFNETCLLDIVDFIKQLKDNS